MPQSPQKVSCNSLELREGAYSRVPVGSQLSRKTSICTHLAALNSQKRLPPSLLLHSATAELVPDRKIDISK